jgi:hypothetical protein
VKTCLPVYLIDNECMHVALYALLFCVIWREQGEQGIAQSRVQEATASCSVLCGDPGSWRNPQSRTPYPVMIVVNPVTLNSARNRNLPSQLPATSLPPCLRLVI